MATDSEREKRSFVSENSTGHLIIAEPASEKVCIGQHKTLDLNWPSVHLRSPVTNDKTKFLPLANCQRIVTHFVDSLVRS